MDPQSVFCEVCAKRAPDLSPHEPLHEGARVSKWRDEHLKRLVKQHPERDAPRAYSVERDELPSAER